MESNSGIFDRRTLIAFVLMFVVFFGWATLSPKFSPDKPVEVESEEPVAQLEPEADGLAFTQPEPPDATPSQAEDVEVAPSSADGWAALNPAGRGQPIRISTPRYEAMLDPVGADLISWTLRDFTLVDGAPVDLVHDRTTDLGQQYAHALSVQLENRALDLRNVVFQADRSVIVLDEGDEPQVLNLVAQRGEGGQLRLQLLFDPDRYGFSVDAQFRGALGDPMPMQLAIGWPRGIAPTEPDSAQEYNEFRAVARVGEDVHKVKFGNLQKGGSKGHANLEGMVSWGGVQKQVLPRRGHRRTTRARIRSTERW